jgi:hypothetical protein
MTQEEQPAVLIVDPIFRGSRLTYSAYAAEALVRRNARVTVLARTGEPPDQYRELFRGVPHDLECIVPTPAEF